MKGKTLLLILCACLPVLQSLASETASIIKVTGVYGIIDKGTNQGVKQDQELYVRRSTESGFQDICKVRVIRTTANRAAVEQIERSKSSLLKKGDKLFTTQAVIPEPTWSSSNVKMARESDTESVQVASTEGQAQKASIPEPIQNPQELAIPEPRKETQANSSDFSSNDSYNIKKPWLGINAGAIIPSGKLANSYSPNLKIGGSYMLSAGSSLDFGLELNKTFFNGSDLALGASTITSSSILEALVVFQRHFGSTFFLEGGGGLYRPSIQILSVDNISTSFSSTNVGLFGGAGIFLPTSPYAGLVLRGRLHNYFDSSPRQYFGLTGGFRFKVR